MAKTRLKTDTRELLYKHALALVEKTPDDPKLIAEVNKTSATRQQAFKALASEALKEYKKKFSRSELATLAKYDLIESVDQLTILGSLPGDNFTVHLFDDESFECEHKRWSSAYREARAAASKSVAVNVPKTWGASSHHSKIPVTAALRKLEAKLIEASKVWKETVAALEEKRTTIKDDYKSLIWGARTFEDVVEVWPEALDIAHEITGPGTAITLVSDESKARIRLNMEKRKAK